MSKILKPGEAPTAISSKWSLGATGQRGAAAGHLWCRRRCGRTLPGASSAAAAPTTPRRCLLPLSTGASFYKSRELGCEPSLTLHSPFSLPLTLTCSTTCKNIFHKVQVQENSIEKCYIHHHQAKLMGCSLCFH